jgi:hypothetical protein
MLTGATLNPNSNVFTFKQRYISISAGGAVVCKLPVLSEHRERLSLNIRTGSSFNAPLNVTTGNTRAYEASSPYDARLYGNITIDNGAAMDLK